MTEIKYAGFFIRLFASFIDTLVLALPLAFFIYLLSNGEWFDIEQYKTSIFYAMNGNTKAVISQPEFSLQWELLFEFSVLIVTLLFWEKYKGATPGKKILKIKIVDALTFEDITNKQAITRSFGYIVSSIPFFLGFFLILFRRDKRALHDILAHTVVIKEV